MTAEGDRCDVPGCEPGLVRHFVGLIGMMMIYKDPKQTERTRNLAMDELRRHGLV